MAKDKTPVPKKITGMGKPIRPPAVKPDIKGPTPPPKKGA
jgi:hypothetical protein